MSSLEGQYKGNVEEGEDNNGKNFFQLNEDDNSRQSDETEALLEQLLALEKEKIRLAKSSGNLSRQQLLQRVSDLQHDIAYLRNASDTSLKKSTNPSDTVRLPSYESSTGESAVTYSSSFDNEYEGYEELVDGSRSLSSSPKDGSKKSSLKPKCLDKFLQRHSESSVISPTLHVHHASVLQHRPASLQLAAAHHGHQHKHGQGRHGSPLATANSPPHGSRVESNRFVSSDNSSSGINNLVTPLITMPNALNYAVTLRDKRQHGTNTTSTFSPDRTADNFSATTGINHSNKAASGVGSRDRRSSIHAVQARYRSGGHSSSGSVGNTNATNHADALLMLKIGDQSHYFSDSASDYSSNSRNASVDRTISPDHPQHHHPNIFISAPNNNNSILATGRQDSVSTTSSNASSLLQDQANFLDPDFTHTYSSPHKPPIENQNSNTHYINEKKNILEFCMVEADWQYLRGLQNSKTVNPSGKNIPISSAINGHGANNMTNIASVLNSFVPPCMIDRFPADIIHDKNSHTRDIQEQSFFFPSGVQVELVSHCVRDVTTRPYYHKRHIVPFTNRDGTPLYACCLTVQQSYQVEDIYALDPLIIDHLVKQYQAKYAATSIQKAYRVYLHWKKQQLWTQSSNTKPAFSVHTSTSNSTSATTSNVAASTSFFGTSNTRSTPRHSTTTSSFFGHYQSNNANSNANSMYINNSVQSSQRLSGKGSDMGSVNGNANGFNSPTILNANHQQQQALVAQHHLKTTNVHKELLNNNATNKPSLFSRFFRTNSTSNPAAHATAGTETPTTGTHYRENVAIVTTNNPVVPAATSTPGTSNISTTIHSSQPNQTSTPSASGGSGGGIFSPAAPLPPNAHTAVASSPQTVVSRLGFFRTSITGHNPNVAVEVATAATSVTASTSAPNSTVTTTATGVVTPPLDDLRIATDSTIDSNSRVGHSGLLTPHRHDNVRLPSNIQRSFDQDDEGEEDDGNDDDEGQEKTKQEVIPDNSHLEASEGKKIQSGETAKFQLNDKEKGVKADSTGTIDSANNSSNDATSSKKENPLEVPLPHFWELPLPPYAMDDSDSSPSNKTASSRYKKKSYYRSRFNLIHDSTFFMDKVVVGQRCYCLISPLPEYTFLFTMLDAIAQAEMQMHRPLQLQHNQPHQDTAVTLTTTSEKEDVSSSGMNSNATVNTGQFSHSKGSAQLGMDSRHAFLQQVSDYMHRFLSQPGNVLHVQDFALNFAVTQDLQLSGIRNRVLEKLAFRRHHHGHHNQPMPYNSEKSESQIAKDALLTEDDTESLQHPHSAASDSNITASTHNIARSKSSVVSIHTIHHKQANKSHSHGHHARRGSHSAAAAAAKYALRVRDYCKISHHYLDSLVPTSEWALAVLITHVSAQTIFKMVNLLLMEKSLIIYGHHAGVVTAITFAIAQLLSPFLWEGIFIPLVPDNAREMFGAPVPLLLGTTSPPRLADVSSSTAVLHLNDHMATVYYDNTNSMVSASSSSMTGAATTNNSNTSQPTGIFSTPNATFQGNSSRNTAYSEASQVPVSEKMARIRNVEFTAWFVRLPEVTADLPIDSEIVKRIDYTRKLLGQYAKEGVHFCYPWKELVAEFTVHKKSRKHSIAETANNILKNNNNNSNDVSAPVKASDVNHDSPSATVPTDANPLPKHPIKRLVIPLKDETLDIHNQIDRLLLAHIPYIIRTQLRIILSVMKRYNATMCGTETFYDDPTTWKRFLRVNPVTQTEEFYPDNYLEPLRSKLEFQDAMVHTQLFVSFMDRLRREAKILDQVREFIGHWIYCRIMVRRTQQRRKENKSRFRSFLIPDSK